MNKHVFIEADYKSFHVATMGYIANSARYIRFSQLDPHSIFTSYIMPSEWGSPIDMSMSDGEILERCRWIKKRCKQAREDDPIHGVDIRQSLAKPTVLGNQLGLGERKLWMQNKRYIHGQLHARQLQAKLSEAFNEIPRTQSEIKERAHNQRYLINEWGYVQWFYEVFTWVWNKKRSEWLRRNGTDAEKALAFPVQSTAFGIIKWNLLEAENRGWNERFNFVNSIHDSVIYMPRVEDRVECVRSIVELYSRPCNRLVNTATGPQGLKVGVEISIGRNWRAYHKDDNPEGMREIGEKELHEEYGIAGIDV